MTDEIAAKRARQKIANRAAPVADFPLSEAVEELTGFEILGIEKRFNGKLEDLGTTKMLIGVVWTLENRKAKTPWKEVEDRKYGDLLAYFPPEDTDQTEDSEQGKED